MDFCETEGLVFQTRDLVEQGNILRDESHNYIGFQLHVQVTFKEGEILQGLCEGIFRT